jgi:hypothetical protein
MSRVADHYHSWKERQDEQREEQVRELAELSVSRILPVLDQERLNDQHQNP